MDIIMKKTSIISALALVCMTVLGLAGCQQELSTEQLSADQVKLGGVAPNPVARGGVLRIVGSNLQKVQWVEIPGVEPIAVNKEDVIAEGKVSEIRVIVPVDGPEVGPVSIVAGDTRLTTKADLTYSEPIVFNGFSPESAMPGDVITVKGDYMNNIRQVIFEGGEAVTEFESQSRYELKVKVPSSAITGKIVIGDVDESNNPEGKVSNLFYSTKDLSIGDPTVKTASYGIVKAGASVTATGTYLNMIESVNFGGVDAEFTVAEEGTSLTAVLPDTAADGDLVLVSYAGKEFKAGAYGTLVPSALKIAAETRYKAGLDVTITGKDIDLVTGGSLAGTELSLAVSDESIKFTIPATAKDGAVTLTLANGKTVDTDAIELVKPVITAVSPLELYAGDENIIVTGDDLDLVVSATLGGKEIEIKGEDDENGEAEAKAAAAPVTSLELVTTLTSVSGKVALTLANGDVVESAEEVNVKYHSLVIVSSMPSAQHIGMEVTLEGSNFDLVENIFIGDTKVTKYSLRTPEKVSFLMPWVKAGSYQMSFHLFNGDVETVATPIEVQLELDIRNIWKDNFVISNWNGNQDLAWGGFDWSTCAPGDVLQFVGTPNDPAADWWCISLRVGSDWNALAGVPGQYDKPGILEVVLTKEIIDDLVARNGLVFTGDGYTVTEINIISEIAQETTVLEANVDLNSYALNYELKPADMFVKAGLKVGQKVRFYITPADDGEWSIQLFDGHWGQWLHADLKNRPSNENYTLVNGAFVLECDETAVSNFTTVIDWGYCGILQGKGTLVKITVE